jgi:hypothetical protein
MERKTNLYYLQDQITYNNFFENQYQINNQIFSTTDNNILLPKSQSSIEQM